MSNVYTWKDVKDEIEEELDLQEEQFVSEQQLVSWFNRALRIAQGHIAKLSEDYYLSEKPLVLVKGQREYDLPDDIYAGMIRNVQYDDNLDSYDLDRIDRLSDLPDERYDTLDDYSYIVFNNTNTGSRIRIYPTPRRDYNSEINIRYIRDVKLVDYNAADRDSQEIDIPEFTKFCIMHVVCKVHAKEKQWQDYQVAKTERDELLQLMISTLAKKERDEQEFIRPDLSFYNDIE